MAKQTRNTLKGYFETGKKPTGNNYADLLDSYLLVDGENAHCLQRMDFFCFLFCKKIALLSLIQVSEKVTI